MNTLSTANSCLNWITLFSEMNEIIIGKNYHQTYSIPLSEKATLAYDMYFKDSQLQQIVKILLFILYLISSNQSDGFR